jgi:uncharacterized protein
LAEKTSQLNEIIASYCKELTKLGINATSVFLYGSYASGTERADSDIDLIIVSPDFTKIKMLERLELLGVAAARILEPVEAYGFTAEEVENRKLTPFWQDILEHKAIRVNCE